MRIVFLIFWLVFSCKSRHEAAPEGSALEGSNGWKELDGSAWKDVKAEDLFKTSAPLFNDTVNEVHIYIKQSTYNRVTRDVHVDVNGRSTNDPEKGGDACKMSGVNLGHIEKLTFVNWSEKEVVTLRDAGIKTRGNTSCSNFAKQYRIKFAEDEKLFEGENNLVTFSEEDTNRIKKQRLYGVKSISLRYSINDPTWLRDRLSSDVIAYGDDIMRKNGAPGAAKHGGSVYRVGFAKVFLHLNGAENGTMIGLFNTAEQVDADLYDSHYGEGVIDSAFEANFAMGSFKRVPASDKELFSAYEPDLIDGDDWKGDKNSPKGAEHRKRGREILTDFITKLNRANSKGEMAAILDVDNVLNYMVAVNLTGHWDSMEGNSNNDFLVHNKNTGRWQIVVWDLDNTFGSVATKTSIFDAIWNSPYNKFMAGSQDLLASNDRPIFHKMMQFYSAEYTERYKKFLDGVYDLHDMDARIANYAGEVIAKYGGVNFNATGDAVVTLKSFKDHRYAYGICGIHRGGKRPRITNGFVEWHNNGASWDKKQPDCL